MQLALDAAPLSSRLHGRPIARCDAPRCRPPDRPRTVSSGGALRLRGGSSVARLSGPLGHQPASSRQPGADSMTDTLCPRASSTASTRLCSRLSLHVRPHDRLTDRRPRPLCGHARSAALLRSLASGSRTARRWLADRRASSRRRLLDRLALYALRRCNMRSVAENAISRSNASASPSQVRPSGRLSAARRAGHDCLTALRRLLSAGLTFCSEYGSSQVRRAITASDLAEIARLAPHDHTVHPRCITLPHDDCPRHSGRPHSRH